jgi:hypothetical protein
MLRLIKLWLKAPIEERDDGDGTRRIGGTKGRANASGQRCSRGSYRQHATKGSNANKGDPSGSGACL